MKDLEGIDQPERNYMQSHEFQPTLNRTSHNKSLVLCDDFDSEFMPHFAQTRNTEYGDTHLTIFKEALTKNTWTQTELARIALLLFDSGVLQATNNELIPWIRKFFTMVGRQDIPKKPSRRDLAFSESENCKKILETFQDLVDYANTTTKGANILNKITRKKE